MFESMRLLDETLKTEGRAFDMLWSADDLRRWYPELNREVKPLTSHGLLRVSAGK